MKFLCGGCKTKYQISDEKVRGKILTIRCQKCSAKIVVRETAAETTQDQLIVKRADEKVEVTIKEKVALAAGTSRSQVGSRVGSDFGDEEMPTSIAPAPGEPDPASLDWFSAIDGVQHGPFSYSEILRRIGSRELLGQHYVWHQHMPAWTRIREHRELAPLVPDKKTGHAPPPLPRSANSHVAAADPSVSTESGGEIVDFASKRAERQRDKEKKSESSSRPRSSKSIAPSSTARTEAAPAKKPISSPAPAKVSGLVREIPQLQIDGTPLPAPLSLGEPPKAPPPQPPAKREGAAKVLVGGSALTSDDLGFAAMQAAADADFAAKDDIFADIPRINEEHTRIKESTRFFVAAAGIQQQQKRKRLGLLVGLGAAVGFVGFLGAWALGFVEITFERIKAPFTASAKHDDEAWEDDEPESTEVRAQLEGDKGQRRRRRKVRPAGAGIASAATVHDETPSGASGPRGDQVTSVTFDASGRSKLDVKLPEAELPEADISGFQVPVDHPELSEDAVRQVVAAKKRSIAICYQESLKSNEKVRGKLEFNVTVKPSGDVAKVSVVKRAARSGALDECIAEKIREWKFPAFSGKESTDVRVPFVLEKEF